MMQTGQLQGIRCCGAAIWVGVQQGQHQGSNGGVHIGSKGLPDSVACPPVHLL